MQAISKSYVLGELITQDYDCTLVANRCQENVQTEFSYDCYFCRLCLTYLKLHPDQQQKSEFYNQFFFV